MSLTHHDAAPSRPASAPRAFATRLFVGGCAFLVLLTPAACSSARSTTPSSPRPLLTGEHQSSTGADPSKTRYHGWHTIDRAVNKGAIEHLVVATPVETIGTRFRTYRLLGPRDQPGELVVERTDGGGGDGGAGGVELTIRLGRFGLPELEQQVLRSIRAELAASP